VSVAVFRQEHLWKHDMLEQQLLCQARENFLSAMHGLACTNSVKIVKASNSVNSLMFVAWTNEICQITVVKTWIIYIHECWKTSHWKKNLKCIQNCEKNNLISLTFGNVIIRTGSLSGSTALQLCCTYESCYTHVFLTRLFIYLCLLVRKEYKRRVLSWEH